MATRRGRLPGRWSGTWGGFEAAHGGTLFIDEIGDFDVSLQVKLLRVLETRAVTPLGSHKEIKVDTRVLAATSRDIRAMMQKNQFREDLYYRLNVITIELPPLRQRMDDIPLLVKRGRERVNEQNHTRLTSIRPEVIEALQQYHWPGNVRELLNVVEGMMVLAESASLELHDLPADDSAWGPGRGYWGMGAATMRGPPLVMGRRFAHTAAPSPANNAEVLEHALSHMKLEDLEKQAIAATLRRLKNNRTHAARAAGDIRAHVAEETWG